jgi:hypothetical protein
MTNNKQSVDQYEEKDKYITRQGKAHQASTGIGGGLVGAAIGGLLGRRVGGVFGAVVGTVAGAFVGKATAQSVNRTVESVVDAAKSVAEGVNQTVNGVGNALKDTVEEVKPSVVGLVDAVKDTVEEAKPSLVGAAKSVAEGVNDTVNGVNGVGNALKGTVEEVKPSVVGLVDVVKDTVEEAKPSLVGAAKSVAEVVNQTVNGLGNALKDTVEEVEPSVISEQDAVQSALEEFKPFVVDVEDNAQAAPEQFEPSDNPNSKLHEEQLIGRQRGKLNQEHPLSKDDNQQARENLKSSQPSKNHQEIDIKSIHDIKIQPRQEEFTDNHPKFTQGIKKPTIQLESKKVTNFVGIIVGTVSVILMGLALEFSPKQKQNLLETKSPKPNLETKLIESHLSISPTRKATPKPTANGWIFLGNINNSSAKAWVRKSLIKGSQSIDSPVVPSVGSIVTITAKTGVMLRKNRPQKPKFNPKEQKALGSLKPREKIKILKVESITPFNTTQPTTKVWAQVHRCGSSSCK